MKPQQPAIWRGAFLPGDPGTMIWRKNHEDLIGLLIDDGKAFLFQEID